MDDPVSRPRQTLGASGDPRVMSAEDSSFFDLAIVGASFAGLVAARTAAMRGLKVVVLEAKPDPGHRVSTTGILVKEAVEEIDVPHSLTRRVDGVRLYAPNLSYSDLHASGYAFLTTDTAELLRWLAAEAARAGADVRFNERFRGCERLGDRFVFGSLGIAVRYILGADGARSRVARHFKLGRNTRFLTGLEIEFENLEAARSNVLHCFVNSRFAPGYLAWVSPGPKLTQVGLAVSHGHKPDLSAFIDSTDHLFHFGKGMAVERRGGRIPCGGLVSPWAAPGVLLIGDAAGQVSPATGGGIRLAFRYGRRAAQAIADFLQSNGPPPEAVLAPEMPGFALKKLFRFGLDLAPPNALVDVALGTWMMRDVARRIYFHRREREEPGDAGAPGSDNAEASINGDAAVTKSRS